MSASLHQDDAGRWCVTGDFDLDSVCDLLTRSESCFEPGKTVEIDLANAGRIDSAGLALVVHWARVAQQRGVRLRLSGVPGQLAKLAAVSNLDTALLEPLQH